MYKIISLIEIGMIGYVLNRKNLIVMIISIEIMFLGISLIFIIGSVNQNDILGQIISILIIGMIGGETVIGIAIIITYYQMKGNLNLKI